MRRNAWGAWAAGLAGAWWWLAPGSGPAWIALAAAGLCLPLAAPLGALLLIALTAPCEQPVMLAGYTVYSTELLLALAAPGALLSLIRRPGGRRTALAPLLWAAPLLAVVAASALLNASASACKGALRWLEFVWAAVLAAHWARRGREAEAVVWALVIAAVAGAVQGLLQTWAGPAARPELASIVIGGSDVTRAGAGYGPNTLALLLALLLPFAATAARIHPRRGLRPAALAAALILLAGVIATFSLTGGIALLTAVCVMFIAQQRKKAAVGLGAVLALLLTAAALGWSGGAGDFLETKLASWRDRWDYFGVAVRLFQTSPWFGIGPGQYRFLAPALGHGVNPIGLLTHPHSLYVSVLAELGAFGLAALLGAMAAAGIFLLRRVRRLPAGWPAAGAWALIAGLAGFAAGNTIEHGLVHDRGVHAALILGAALAWVRRPPRPRRPERRRRFEAAWRSEPVPAGREELLRTLEERRRERAPLYELIGHALDGAAAPRILELGCGPALDALQLADRAGTEVHALDAAAAALERAAAASGALGRDVRLHRADVRRTGLASGSFDLIFSQGLLEHFPDPSPVWAETARLLKPGGFAVADVPQAFNPYTLAKLWHRWRGDWPWGWETQYTRAGLRAAAAAAGLTSIAARGYGYRGGVLDITAWVRDRMRPRRPRAWDEWERKTGSWWMMNLVMLFRKE